MRRTSIKVASNNFSLPRQKHSMMVATVKWAGLASWEPAFYTLQEKQTAFRSSQSIGPLRILVVNSGNLVSTFVEAQINHPLIRPAKQVLKQ